MFSNGAGVNAPNFNVRTFGISSGKREKAKKLDGLQRYATAQIKFSVGLF